jgi:hypothetical protein
VVPSKNLSLNIQTFEEIIHDNRIYVDKTAQIHTLLTTGKTYFLSRPRRFGKSLLISTFEAIFQGRKDLFEGLAISKTDYSWPAHPVIRLDFGSIPHKTPKELEKGICSELIYIADLYGMNLKKSQNATELLKNLIRELSQRNRVVILIDEYDKPILDHMTDPDKARGIQLVLKSFYETIKALDAHIKFIFLTGITKFTKTSIFSSLNNLNDISEKSIGGHLLGYNQGEIEHFFPDHLIQSAQYLGLTVEALLVKIKEWYNGYQFCTEEKSERVYSPLSVMYCLDDKLFKNYWFETATSSHLVNLIRLGRYDLTDFETLEPIRVGNTVFSPCDLSDVSLEALLYQAGYLTIQSSDQQTDISTLDYPNREVRGSMHILLIGMKSGISNVRVKPAIEDIKTGFLKKNFPLMVSGLQAMVAQIPFMHHKPDEHYYHDLFHMILITIGFRVTSEPNVHTGRPDLVIDTEKQIFIVELKLNKSADNAMAQMKERRYHEKYQMNDKPITLVGINFEYGKKKISISYVADELNFAHK